MEHLFGLEFPHLGDRVVRRAILPVEDLERVRHERDELEELPAAGLPD